MKLDTCIGEGAKCTVEFDYQPEEKAIYYGESPYPGCDASADINAVWIDDSDLYEDLNNTCLQRLEQECIYYAQQEDET